MPWRIDQLFWAAGFLGHLLLLGVLVVKGRTRTLPLFTAFVTFNVFRSPTLYLLSHYGTDAVYLKGYMFLVLIDAVLQLAVTYEIAYNVFRPMGRWAPDVRSMMLWLFLGSLLVASGLTWLAAPGAPRWEFATMIKANFFSATLLTELLIGMLVLSARVGLSWRTHTARVAYGFGAYFLLAVLIEAAHAIYGGIYKVEGSELLTFIRQLGYLAVLTYWIGALWQEAPAARELSDEMRQQLLKLHARLAYDLYSIRHWRKQ